MQPFSQTLGAHDLCSSSAMLDCVFSVPMRMMMTLTVFYLSFVHFLSLSLFHLFHLFDDVVVCASILADDDDDDDDDDIRGPWGQ
jgi:hypothetical protein